MFEKKEREDNNKSWRQQVKKLRGNTSGMRKTGDKKDNIASKKKRGKQNKKEIFFIKMELFFDKSNRQKNKKSKKETGKCDLKRSKLFESNLHVDRSHSS